MLRVTRTLVIEQPAPFIESPETTVPHRGMAEAPQMSRHEPTRAMPDRNLLGNGVPSKTSGFPLKLAHVTITASCHADFASNPSPTPRCQVDRCAGCEFEHTGSAPLFDYDAGKRPAAKRVARTARKARSFIASTAWRRLGRRTGLGTTRG